MDVEKLKKSLESRGWDFRQFSTGAEAADYLAGELAGSTERRGGCGWSSGRGPYD